MAKTPNTTGKARAVRRSPAPLGEAAISGDLDITKPYIDPYFQVPTDRVLRARGGNLEIYREVLRDDQVKACFQQRRAAVVGRELLVEAGGERPVDKEAAEALSQNLKRLARWDQVCDAMLYGVFYGYAVGECMWSVREGRIELADVRVRNRARFKFDKLWKLRLIEQGRPEGVVMPERKFWTFTAGADHDDEPYGLGLAHWLFWPTFFKRNGIKFWLIFLEKFGQPTVLGKYPRGATKDEKSALLEAAAAVSTRAGITVPVGTELTLLEAARSGSGTYREMVEAMDAAIAKIILSQTMTTDDGSSHSQSQTHMDVRQEITRADGDLLSASFNAGPATWLTEWNFPGAAPPRVWRNFEDAPDLKLQSEIDGNLKSLGYPPTEEHVKATYGEGYARAAPESDPPPAVVPGQAQPPAAFAEPAPDAIDALIDSVDDWTPLVDPLLAPVRDLVDQAGSLEELRDLLAEALPRMDHKPLAEHLARAAFAARVTGEEDIPITDATEG